VRMGSRWMICLILASCLGEDPDLDDKDDSEPVDTEPTPDTEPVVDTDCPDADQDGAACDDCDDQDAERAPGKPERCNGLDDDCDEVISPVEVDTHAAGACESCFESGYWEMVRDSPDGEDLWARLALGVRTNTACWYSETIDWMMLTLDKDGGEVECVYTGVRVEVGDERPPTDLMNTEHTWPKSLGGGEGSAECDLHHLFPTLSEANNKRANYPLRPVVREVDWTQGGSSLGEDSTGQTAFEPRDEHKGDASRALFYMALRYGMELSPSDAELYRSWHADDPVGSRDLARSLMIRGRQGNANPFVVCPTTVSSVSLP
jgi:hypothetical protein